MYLQIALSQRLLLFSAKKMKTIKKIFSILFAILSIILILLAYGSIDNRWYRVITVEGNSMSPTLWIGDLIVVTPPTEKLDVDMVVTMSINGNLVTHRIVGFTPEGKPLTKGDANQTDDNFLNSNLQIVGICRLRLPGLGYPLLILNGLLKGT